MNMTIAHVETVTIDINPGGKMSGPLTIKDKNGVPALILDVGATIKVNELPSGSTVDRGRTD
jgi:hypothetical protein